MSNENLFDELKSQAGKLWEMAQDHPFVHGIADGTLARGKFVHYLEQDYAYLIGYSRAIALATAKAPNLPRMNAFAALLNETLSVEMELHRGLSAQFGVTPEQLEGAEASPVCQAYIDFCISAAAIGDAVDLLAALVPCCVGYAEIGMRLKPRVLANEAHPYKQWIENYASEEYQDYAAWMKSALSEMGEGLPGWRGKQLKRLFTLGCRYEWLFWEMAWKEETWPL
ncbi:thiaminase II [bacterium]|nr:thiaminase II [bacterium]